MPSAPTTRFSGAARQKCDDKGRITLPKRWQPEVEALGKMILAAAPQGCLLLMPESRWEAVVAKLDDDPLGGAHHRLRFLFVGHREEITPDKAGRIVVPEVLRRYAGIDLPDHDTVYLVGVGEDVQIWSAERWNQQIEAVLSQSRTLFDQHSPDSLTPVP